MNNETELKEGTRVRIPVSFGHISADGKTRRVRTGTVEATFLSYRDTEKKYASVVHEGDMFVVSIGQIVI